MPFFRRMARLSLIPDVLQWTPTSKRRMPCGQATCHRSVAQRITNKALPNMIALRCVKTACRAEVESEAARCLPEALAEEADL